MKNTKTEKIMPFPENLVINPFMVEPICQKNTKQVSPLVTVTFLHGIGETLSSILSLNRAKILTVLIQ